MRKAAKMCAVLLAFGFVHFIIVSCSTKTTAQSCNCPAGPQGAQGAQGPQGPQGPAGTAGSAVWYGSSNVVALTTTPSSIIQPAPQLTQAGSYMFLANLTLQETQSYATVTCFVQVGSTDLLPSITQTPGVQFENMTATGAITLTSANVPTTASLVCSETGGTANVTQASVSIIQVGTLQIGP